MPRAASKVFDMPPPTSTRSTRGSRWSSASILPRILAPPTISTKGRGGIVEQPAELPQFAVQQQSAEGPIHPAADGSGRRVSAVRGAEGVVYVDLAQSRKLGSKRRIVALLAGVEAEVLAQADGAVAESGRGLPGRPGRRSPPRRRQHGRVPLPARRPPGAG